MELTFLTPQAAASGALALAPLVAAGLLARRSARVRARLGLDAPLRRSTVPPLLSLAALGLLLGLAAAQPVLSSTTSRATRTDAEALFVIDASRSMLAAPDRGEPTRFARARDLAAKLRDAIPTVPAGIATLTDRVVPHVLPTADPAVFRSVLERAIAVDRPPPATVADRITTFDPLHDLGSTNVFRAAAKRRLIVLLTDGEAREPDVANIRRGIPPESGYRLLLVRVWRSDERIYRRGGDVEFGYTPDPAGAEVLARIGGSLNAPVFEEGGAEQAADQLRRLAGAGRTAVRTQQERRRTLAPWLVAAALLPLAVVLVSRNRP